MKENEEIDYNKENFDEVKDKLSSSSSQIMEYLNRAAEIAEETKTPLLCILGDRETKQAIALSLGSKRDFSTLIANICDQSEYLAECVATGFSRHLLNKTQDVKAITHVQQNHRTDN